MADAIEEHQEEATTLPGNIPPSINLDGDVRIQHDLRTLAGTLIMNEQTLINNRMTWLMTFQGLLFASFALTASTTNDPEIKTIITDVVPYAGMLVAITTLLGVIAAFLAITRTKRSLNEKLAVFPEIEQRSLIPHGTPLASFLGRATTYCFPLIIAGTWLIIASRVREAKIEERKNKIEAMASPQLMADSASNQPDSADATLKLRIQKK